MAVKIETMEMPESCNRCRFCDYIKEEGNFLCLVTKNCITMAQFLNDIRIAKCPLQEVKE